MTTDDRRQQPQGASVEVGERFAEIVVVAGGCERLRIEADTAVCEIGQPAALPSQRLR